MITVLVDAGHGGDDSGAVSHDGLVKEKDVSLAVSFLVVEGLTRYEVKTEMTRRSDVFLTLSQRAEMANQRGAKLMSIHCNSGGGTGAEVFTSPGQTRSDPWATECIEEYAREFPELAIRTDLGDGDPDKEARFTVLTQTDEEAILFELGFIDVKDLAFLTNEENWQRMADALVRATVRHFGLVLKGEAAVRPEEVLEARDVYLMETQLAEILGRVEKAEWQLKEAKKLIEV